MDYKSKLSTVYCRFRVRLLKGRYELSLPVGATGGEPMKMKLMFLAVPVLFACGVFAQSSIPPGTILPARLNSSLNPRKIHPGQRITARIMQDVPLPSGRKIPSGSKLAGQILSVETHGPQSAKINFRFDQLHFSHHSVGISAHLRALASVMQVEDAQTPPTGPDRGTPWVWATRNLIGVEVAYGTGPVARGTEIVGEGVIDGVLLPARANPDRGCRGEAAGNSAPQAFWVFSSDACGVYGLEDLQISHAGRTPPVGEVMLSSNTGRLNVRAGSGLLLRVNFVAEQ